MEKPFDEDDAEIDLAAILYALKRKIVLIISIGILGACASFLYTAFLVTPTYTSTSSMLVLTKETTLSSLSDLQMGSQLVNDYKVLMVSRPVLSEVIANLDLSIDYKQLKNMISINIPSDARVLELSVTCYDPCMAKIIVDELAEVSSAYIGDKMEVVPPKIIETGEVPTQKTSPNTKKNVMLGLLLGLCLSAGVVALIEILDDTIKSEEDVEKYLGLPTLANVPDRKDYISGRSRKRSQNRAQLMNAKHADVGSKKEKTVKKTAENRREGK